jgi:hypothetical protein
MNPAASDDWEDENAARALLQQHVADIHPAPDLIDRVEAGIRQRRRTRRIVLPVTMVTAAACVVALAFAVERTAAPVTHVAQAAQPVIACPNPLPSGWANAGVPATPPVPGAARALLPGVPKAAVSCSTIDPARATALTAQQLSAAVAALAAAPFNSSTSTTVVIPPCEEPAQLERPLYLIFEYPDGTHLTITANAETACDGYGPVSWYANNGQVHTAAFQSSVLDSLAGSAASTASAASVAAR